MKYKNIYVAASRQHVGKTTSTLGLVSGFMQMGINVGYCKPVGQKHVHIENLTVDKDTVLFADLIGFNIDPLVHSPIILGKGATAKYLDDPSIIDLEDMIEKSNKELRKQHDLVIYEGTGHPGVGSVAGMSNARAASLLNAGVVIVIEGGIGSTIDMLNMCLSLFREHKVQIIGVIINKVKIEKLDKVKEYVGMWLEKNNLPLLGVIPYDKTLAYPLISTIAQAVEGTIIYNSNRKSNKVDSILAGSLVDIKELQNSSDQLLVVSTRSINEKIKVIQQLLSQNNIKSNPLSGIVATGSDNIDGSTLKFIEENNLPLIRTNLDTFGCVIKISNIEVKINRATPWKVMKAINLITENVDFEKILEKI